jgi:SCY1-like protein 2
LSGSFQEPRSAKSAASSILDKFTIQEKVVPLLKAIKTKEPAVMMAALNVFRQVGEISDTEFVALEVLPVLWNFSLGPLLNVQQFSSFMDLIKSLSSKIEREQKKKLQALSSTDGPGSSRCSNSATFGEIDDINGGVGVADVKSDFERLVLGSAKAQDSFDDLSTDWNPAQLSSAHPKPDIAPKFSWSSATSNSNLAMNVVGGVNVVSGQPGPNSRSITPDMNVGGFSTLQPTNKQQTSGVPSFPVLQPTMFPTRTTSGSAGTPRVTSPLGQTTWKNTQFSPLISPPPKSNFQNTPAPGVLSSFSNATMNSSQSQLERRTGSNTIPGYPGAQGPSQQKQGLDKYESLL